MAEAKRGLFELSEHPHLEHRTMSGLGCYSGLVLLGSNFCVYSQSSVLVGNLFSSKRVSGNASISMLGRQIQATHGCLDWMSIKILFAWRFWDSFAGGGTLTKLLVVISSAQSGPQ